jgi:hypothetical protein
MNDKPRDYAVEVTDYYEQTPVLEVDRAQLDYEAWQREQENLALLEEERRQWELAMPHKSIIFMNKMKDCPHKKPIPILDKVIYPGALTILAGDPKAGKSTFLFHALQAISEGQPFCGLSTSRVTTLYASEQPFQSLNTQVERIPRGEYNNHVGFIPYEFNYIEREMPSRETGKTAIQKVFPGTWIEQINFWHDKVREIKAGLLVVDTFTAFALFKGGEAFDSGPVTTRLQQLKSLQADAPDLAIVVCHHLRKEDEEEAYGERSFSDIANSYALRAASDMNVIMWKPSARVEDKNLRSMKIEGRFLVEDANLSFRKIEDDFQLVDAPIRLHPHQVILSIIQKRPDLNRLSVRELSDEIGKTKSLIARFRNEYPQDHPIFAPQGNVNG